MSNIKNARMVKEIIDALSTLTIELVQLKNSACNAYCVVLSNEQANAEAYSAAFARNALNKIAGLKTILNEVQRYADKLIPEGTPVDFGNVKPWEGVASE